MSFLTPLYILGAIAIVGPIVFHLIRRSPRGEVPFSSIMFLAATPPRLTRRSRLDDVLLLILRAVALALLAFAFARPFLREVARLNTNDVEERRVAILIDTSASMRRGELWDRANELAEETIDELRPGDRVAILGFDSASRPALTFSESGTVDLAQRQTIARARLAELEPTWGATNLGQALIDAVAAIEDVPDASQQDARMPRRIVLISDLQEGSQLEALGAFEWPRDVEVELKTVASTAVNAGLERLADSEPNANSPATADLRFRVTNESDSGRESFELSWLDANGRSIGRPQSVYVPPGQTRVVALSRPDRAVRLKLHGDKDEFDNELFIADEQPESAVVHFVGEEDVDDARGLLYYVKRVFEDSLTRNVSVAASGPEERLDLDPNASPLVIVAAPPSASNAEALASYADSGGTILYVLRSTDDAASFASIANMPLEAVEEAKINGDVMLGMVDFSHPLFAPLAGAQYNDFTKIHFWKYRRVDEASLSDARIIARFENGDAAVVEKPIGKGRVVLMTGGWSPDDSQLARSSKFVPLMVGLLDRRGSPRFDGTSIIVNSPVTLPTAWTSSGPITIRSPGGATQTLDSGQSNYSDTDLPGIYTVALADGVKSFAVNLDPAESRTAPLETASLEQLGLRFAGATTAAEEAEQRRQMLNAELESRQKLWRWFIIAAIGVLIVETWIAGRPPRLRSVPEEALAT